MSALEIAAVLLGLGILALIVLGLTRGEFDAEAPKYEMLGLEPPVPPQSAHAAGRLGPVDRVVRLGLIGAAFYYAARWGWASPLGVVLSLIGVYVTVTGLWGKDPVYRLLARTKRARH